MPLKMRAACCLSWRTFILKPAGRQRTGRDRLRLCTVFGSPPSDFDTPWSYSGRYGPSLDRRLKAVHQLQDVLGKISDYQTILNMLAADQEMVAKVRRSLKRKSKEFPKRWKAFDSGGQLKQWKTYLGRGLRAAPARKRKVAASS